jgi:hypothetical protein
MTVLYSLTCCWLYKTVYARIKRWSKTAVHKYLLNCRYYSNGRETIVEYSYISCLLKALTVIRLYVDL